MTIRHELNRTATFALAALCFGSAVTLLTAQAPAARPASASKVLIEAALGDVDQRVTITSLPVPKGITVSEHSHQGPVFAYILEGNIENQVDPDPAKIYHPGDFFYEPAMHVHRLLRNLSSTEPARLITFTVGATGKAGETAKPNPAIKTLLQERAEVANRQARLSILALEPGWWGAGFEGGGAHQHPGPIFAYILKGAIESQVDPDPARIYRAGDLFYEPQMHAHRLFRNVSQTEPAELLMFQIFDKGAPTALGVK
jgi:quercetin dioxygenase-like cupin family protein